MVAAIPATALVVGLATLQPPPPNLVENGDARAGAWGWQRIPGDKAAAKNLNKDAFVETVDGAPCFLVRNQASWIQRITPREDYAGKYVLIIGRGSSERVHADDNITGLPYLWAQLWSDGPPSNANYLQGMRLESKMPNEWRTMHGIFPIPKGVRAITLKLGQAERKGTPQNGSAARITDVEMRVFETRAEAAAYVAVYEALYAK